MYDNFIFKFKFFQSLLFINDSYKIITIQIFVPRAIIICETIIVTHTIRTDEITSIYLHNLLFFHSFQTLKYYTLIVSLLYVD